MHMGKGHLRDPADDSWEEKMEERRVEEEDA